MSIVQNIPSSGSGVESATAPAASKTQGLFGVAVSSAAPTAPADAAAQAAALPQAIASLNSLAQVQGPSLQFLIDQASGEPIVKVIDVQTRQLLFQLPTGKALEVARHLDQVSGLLIDQKA